MPAPDITFYGLKTCDTCRKALKALESAGKDAQFVDIRAEADLQTKLPEWISAAGAPALVNKRSTTWRNLSEADIAKIEAGNAIDILMQHPTLIKRPVIEADGAISIGWSKQTAQSFT